MPHPCDRTWLEVDLDVIAENYAAIQTEIGPACGQMAVLKGDAYGLGAVPIARRLEQLGCPILATASLDEALELRAGGVRTPVFIMSPIPARHAALAVREGFELIAVSLKQARELSREAAAAGVTVPIHIKADVGLTRFGIAIAPDPEAAVQEALAIAALPGLEAVAVLTHYTAIEVPLGEHFNLTQIARFEGFCARLREAGLRFKVHSASTMFTALYPRCFGDYVRTAALVLGLAQPEARGVVTKASAALRTRILQIKEVPAGTPVSYGPNVHTLRPTRTAVVAIGFADGLRRDIAGRVSFMLRGRWAPTLGKMTMDYTMLDITDIPEAQEGDIVTLFGRDGALERPSWALAALYPGTVAELTAVLSGRIPRVYSPCTEDAFMA